jgi:hypothetical protein
LIGKANSVYASTSGATATEQDGSLAEHETKKYVRAIVTFYNIHLSKIMTRGITEKRVLDAEFDLDIPNPLCPPPPPTPPSPNPSYGPENVTYILYLLFCTWGRFG